MTPTIRPYRALMRPAFVWVALVCAPLWLTTTAARGSDDDPWAALRALRQQLVAESPLTANFLQTFTPAGFSTGEREEGRLYLALPECLRWDYDEPYPRSYLLCEDTVWAWSPGEAIGDRYERVSRDEPGLDFLWLSVDRLAERYAVDESSGADGSLVLDLSPLATGAPFSEARIVLDATRQRPVEISYSDQEGNRTTFRFTRFRGQEDAAVFSAPAGVDWMVNE